MTTENPNPNETAADATDAGEDTALGAAAAADEAKADDADQKTDADKADEEAGKTGSDKEADDKAGGEKDKVEAPEGAPEAYDISAFKMPEGVVFDEEGFKAIEPNLRELNLSQDQAGKLMTAYAEKIVPKITERTLAKIDNDAAELRANLARDLQKDPEVGGTKLEESRSLAAKAIAHFLPDKTERAEFSRFLNESGFGNDPRLMRIIAGAGRTLSEATTAAAQTASQPLSESQKFYG